MVLSLGRRLYNLTSRHEAVAEVARPARPAGVLVWLHAPSAAVASGLAELARRVSEDDLGTVLFSGPDADHGRSDPLLRQAAPPDTTADVRAFLAYWSPGLIVIADGEIRPALLHEAQSRGVPVVIIDGSAPYLLRGREGWYPGLLRGALATVRQVMALDDAAARAFRKAGAGRVDTSGRLEMQSAALPCQEAERAVLTQLVATRPIWLAAAVAQAEESAVILAHRAALRLAHRLLLILVPQDPARADDLARKMQGEEGWHVAQRGLEQEPDPDVEVYIPDGEAEYGLWYRLAPITFLGGSLAGDGCARNPMEAAALGSAIVHGPRPGVFGAPLGRLGAGRAATAVSSPADLAEALGTLLSPDQSARSAAAAWTVTSEGADATETVLALIRSLLAEAR